MTEARIHPRPGRAETVPAPPRRAAAGPRGILGRLTRAGRHRVVEYCVTAAGWPAGAAPLTVVLLGDHHVGSHAGDLARHAAICEEANGLGADLILLLGDYVNTMGFPSERVPPGVVGEILGRLAAPLGVHAILGNHDWHYGADEVARALSRHGIEVYLNRGVRLAHRGTPFTLAGLADNRRRRPDFGAALAGAAADEPVIVMAHDPWRFAAMPRRPGLMVAGHTHGGQWVVPGLGPLWIASHAPLRWAHGHVEEEGRALVVSAGLGASMLPWRINRPPEIVVVTLSG